MLGVFDSGLGGLTVVKELFRQLPGYDILYFGDTARLPYGNKSPEAIRRFSVEITDFLIARGAKVVVIACNTASALAADAVRERAAQHGVPVFEVVTPAVEAALRATKRGRIGVVGTRGTVASGVHERTVAVSKTRGTAAKVFAAACPLFVPFVEEGMTNAPELRTIAKGYVRPLLAKRIDTLILGCTHYPFLKSVLAKAAPGVTLVDPAHETARAVKSYLGAHPDLDAALGKGGKAQFFFSDVSSHAQQLARRWLRKPIVLQQASAALPEAPKNG